MSQLSEDSLLGNNKVSVNPKSGVQVGHVCDALVMQHDMAVLLCFGEESP